MLTTLLLLGSGVLAADATPATAAAEPPKFVVRGAIRVADVRAVITEHKAAIAACYSTALKEQADLAGRMTFTWKVNERGAVQSAAVSEATMKSKVLEKCLGALVASWRFTAPADEQPVTVVYPFTFGVRTERLDLKTGAPPAKTAPAPAKIP